ncbi:tRNA (N6-threonylcarbamoyladenosine(37)-N6)-methyltransferase TrmO [Brevibacillus laterosporus]|uniref:tRNA (N6-threonylcarbamoyladenosine(37)-N6)-methyltransferase TrmO n=1 Tax=Brevibacillus laterosporus TaxID=1465 RepID=UPI00264D494B|nr:tRNA (N6-threonylcarbamoyladenosine(37)-N6)-methyltransferase TrmO [Brevibacillus laterosporus]MDN9010297.1 tRNA (N6-threonylcarbamoyladenosine(37)-N6)-methyltransferase TrmO [Brevibacillus laterosporus]MDO0941184.1 tRNA (N6-threonylcarbamoyladenosine(37)-N6)-methyltransferase TrmO [Brevibacillus laterosporus]
MTSFTVQAIGVVQSPVLEGKDEKWGEVISEILIYPPFQEGLLGLENFSHVIILFYMHKSSFQMKEHLIRRPQDRVDMPLTGIFAQRAKHRPTPIGSTAVRIMDIHKDRLIVKGLDAIHETPVLDIKPYFPAFDHVSDIQVPDWVDHLMKQYF